MGKELNLEINVPLMPKQAHLYNIIESGKYSVIGYGGARGGAKSAAISKINLSLCWKYNGLKTLIFRRYRQDLLDNHVSPLLAEYPELRPYFNKTDMILTFPNGSSTKFGYADKEDDIYQYRGREYDIEFIDEATLTTQMMIQMLRTSNRTKILPRAMQVMTMNPGGVSHNYIRRIFIDKDYEEYENPDDYYFIQSKVQDNVIWVMRELEKRNISIDEYYSWSDEKRLQFTMKYADYAKNLMALPEEERKAHLEGDWDVFGGLFFKGFDKKKCVIDPFPIPKEWSLVGSLDPGFSAPLSFSLIAQDFDRNVYVIGTYYEREKSPLDHADDINSFFWGKDSLFKEIIGNRRPDYIVSGLDAWAKRDRYAVISHDITIADVFAKKKLPLRRATTDRKAGWMNWKSYIHNNKFFVFKDYNKDLLNEMATAETDPRNVEDIKGKGNDPNVSDHCFVKGTPVLTSKGYKPIEDIELNEEVLTSEGYKPVILRHKIMYAKVVTYNINGVEITCTPSHKFKTSNRGYVPVSKLLDTDMLITKKGQQKADVQIIKSEHTDDVYDLTVQDKHEYYVHHFLVHNSLDSVRYNLMSLRKPSLPKPPDTRPEWQKRKFNNSNQVTAMGV